MKLISCEAETESFKSTRILCRIVISTFVTAAGRCLIDSEVFLQPLRAQPLQWQLTGRPHRESGGETRWGSAWSSVAQAGRKTLGQ